MSQPDPEERIVVWGPALPGAVVTLIATAINFWLGTALAVLAVGWLASRPVVRRWGAWAWVALGALVGAGVYWLLVAFHALF